MPKPLLEIEPQPKPGGIETERCLRCNECPKLSPALKDFWVLQWEDDGSLRLATYANRLPEKPGIVACSVKCAKKAFARLMEKMGE